MLDWNGDGQLTPDEVALTLALLSAQQQNEEAYDDGSASEE